SRSSDACFIECLGITANDVRYRLPRGADTAALERIGNTGDMLIQATLGDQRAGDNRSTDEPEWQKQQSTPNDTRDHPDDTDKEENRDRSHHPPYVGTESFAVPSAFQACDQAPHPGDRVTD